MTIIDAVKKIIELKGLDIFKNLKQFLAFLDDLAPEYQKERKIIKNNFDENILGLFVDESKRPNQRLRWVQIKLDDVGLAKDWADFIIESFGIAFGWENEVQDLKVNAPILNNAPKAIPQQESVNNKNYDYIEVKLNETILKQLGYDIKYNNKGKLNQKLDYLKRNGEDVKDLIIPSIYTYNGKDYKITQIGFNTFANASLLENITIPNSITEIGDKAFENIQYIEYNGKATGAPWGANKVINKLYRSYA